MKICIIGDRGGHIASVFESKSKLDFIGAAPDSPDFSMDNFLGFAKSKGYNMPLYGNWQEMLLKLKPDIAAVDSVFSKHSEIAAFALNHGINVYCEKPAATNREGLNELKHAADSSGAKLFSMFSARYEPWFYTAKKLADSGAAGEIRLITGQKSYKLGSRADFYSRRSTYGGTIPWVAIHSLDQILWISGQKCSDVFARQSEFDNKGHGELETACSASLSLSGGAIAQITADYFRPESAPTHGDDRLRIVGSQGIIEVINNKVFLINNKNDGVCPVELLNRETMVDGFINIISGSRDPIYSGSDGIYAAEVALAARRSADESRLIQL